MRLERDGWDFKTARPLEQAKPLSPQKFFHADHASGSVGREWTGLDCAALTHEYSQELFHVRRGMTFDSCLPRFQRRVRSASLEEASSRYAGLGCTCGGE